MPNDGFIENQEAFANWMTCGQRHSLALSPCFPGSILATSFREIVSSLFVCLFYVKWEEVSGSWKSFFWCIPLPPCFDVVMQSQNFISPAVLQGFQSPHCFFHMAVSALRERPRSHRGPLFEKSSMLETLQILWNAVGKVPFSKGWCHVVRWLYFTEYTALCL